LRIAKCREALKIEHDHLAELRAALAHIEVLIELFFVLDEKEARTAVVEDVLDLSGGIGRIDAVGDAANAHDTHVGIEPFRLGLGENGNNFAAPQPETDEPEANPFGTVTILMPRRRSPNPKPLLAKSRPRSPFGNSMVEQPWNGVAPRDLDRLDGLSCDIRFHGRRPPLSTVHCHFRLGATLIVPRPEVVD